MTLTSPMYNTHSATYLQRHRLPHRRAQQCAAIPVAAAWPTAATSTSAATAVSLGPGCPICIGLVTGHTSWLICALSPGFPGRDQRQWGEALRQWQRQRLALHPLQQLRHIGREVERLPQAAVEDECLRVQQGPRAMSEAHTTHDTFQISWRVAGGRGGTGKRGQP